MLLESEPIESKQLFLLLYNAQTEEELNSIISNHPEAFKREDWVPIGGNESNYGIIESLVT